MTGRRTRFAHTARVGAVIFCALLGTLMQGLVIPLLPRIPTELQLSQQEASWLVTATLVAGAIGNVVFAAMADSIGYRRATRIVLVAVLAGSIVGGAIPGISAAIAGRALQGLGLALVPIGIGSFRVWLSGPEQIRATALLSAMVGIGGTVGFIIGSFGAEALGLAGMFWLSAVLAAVALVFSLAIASDPPVVAHVSFDAFGIAGLSIWVTALLVALTNAGKWGWFSAPMLVTVATCVIVGGAWARHELRVPAPLVDLRLMTRRRVAWTHVAMIAVGLSMYVMILILPRIVQAPQSSGFGLGAGVQAVGVIMVPGGLLSLLAPRAVAWLLRFFPPERVMGCGAVLIAAGYGSMLVISGVLVWVVVVTAITAFGVSLCFAAAPLILARSTPIEVVGQVNGVNNLARSLGGSASSAVSAMVIAAFPLSAAGVVAEQAMVLLLVFATAAALVVFIISILLRESQTTI